MKTYVGTKIIQAEPEVRDGVDGYKVIYADGYVSWSPKDVFEVAYREITNEESNLIVDVVVEEHSVGDIIATYDERKEDA